MVGRRHAIRWLAAAGLAAVAAPALAATVESEAQAMGGGLVRVYAELDADGAPAALGVRLDAAALDGLPPEMNTYSRCFDKNGNGTIDAHGECNGDYELAFALPGSLAENGRMPFSWIGVNWNPMGHPPPAPPPWAVPHFDFHFYIQPEAEVRAIRPGACAELIDCDDFAVAQRPVPARYVHPDFIEVGAAVPAMGDHLIDSKTPELAPGGPPFTETFIYGAYDGHVTFYEPMITRAFLLDRPDQCTPLKAPAAFEKPGFYPREYCIRALAGGDYTVSIEKFVWRDGG